MNFIGSCHCGNTQFTLISEPITNAMMCNCSICRRKNLVMSEQWYDEPQLTFTQGFEKLHSYRWQDKDLNHLFCAECGVHIGASSVSSPTKVRLNLGCIESIDIPSLSIRHFNGRDDL